MWSSVRAGEEASVEQWEGGRRNQLHGRERMHITPGILLVGST